MTHLRTYTFSAEMLAKIFAPGSVFRVDVGIPKDAKIVSIYSSPIDHKVALVAEVPDAIENHIAAIAFSPTVTDIGEDYREAVKARAMLRKHIEELREQLRFTANDVKNYQDEHLKLVAERDQAQAQLRALQKEMDSDALVAECRRFRSERDQAREDLDAAHREMGRLHRHIIEQDRKLDANPQPCAFSSSAIPRARGTFAGPSTADQLREEHKRRMMGENLDPKRKECVLVLCGNHEDWRNFTTELLEAPADVPVQVYVAQMKATTKDCIYFGTLSYAATRGLAYDRVITKGDWRHAFSMQEYDAILARASSSPRSGADECGCQEAA